ncbi:uncharacterized protein LOC144124249 [Amblyomma americanum]
MSGRGNRAFASDEEYQVILPTLPTGRVVLNTVFLHADVRARPYRVEDFRDALAQLMLLPEVIALGAYRMSHVWAVTFASAEAVTKILSAGDLKVKDRRCLVIDPANQDVRVKLHWLLHNVPDEDVRVAFAPYGKVSEVSKERWRVQGVASKGSTTRLVSLKMNPGVKLEDLPHEVRVGGELALVVVPGRAPLCLRCHGTGHIRRECKVPRCGACRRYGHEESSCVRTYASAAVPVNTEDVSELLLDEADAEEVSGGNDSVPKVAPAPPLESTDTDRKQKDVKHFEAGSSDLEANSADDIKIVLRPRGLAVKDLPQYKVVEAVVAATGRGCKEEDLLVRLRHGSNIIIVSTANEDAAKKVLHIRQINFGGKSFAVNTHAAAPEGTLRGVIHGPAPKTTSEELKAHIRLRTQGVRVITARMLGNSSTALITFDGPTLPKFVIYHSSEYRCHPYRPTRQDKSHGG